MVDDSYTKTLLHFNGTDGSTTFTDENGRSWSIGGNAQIDTINKKFGTGSGLFDGNGDYIYLPYTSDFAFGNADFTMECYIYPVSMPTSDAWPTDWSSHMSICGVGTVGQGDGCNLVLGQTKLILQSNDGQIINATHGMSINNWYHIAVTRSGNNFRLFVNGTQIGSTVSSSVSMGIGNNFYIGCETGEGAWFNGYIDELRVSKGIARWVSNFTPQNYEYSSIVTTNFLKNYRRTRFPGSITGIDGQNAYGGTITYDGNYVIHTFTSSGTFVCPGSGTAEVLVVAGGGGGATDLDVGGGGGGGGFINSNLSLTAQSYTVTVGNGGNPGTGVDWTGVGGGTNGSQGQNSVFSTLTAIGGGYGGTRNSPGGAGGSGGGGGDASQTGGAGTSGQGNTGGTGPGMNSNAGNDSGGGGGAGGAASYNHPGIGLSCSITGSAVTYAAGGRGAQLISPAAGAANTGNGGTGGRAGGSGIVVIRYLINSLQL